MLGLQEEVKGLWCVSAKLGWGPRMGLSQHISKGTLKSSQILGINLFE